MVAANCAVATDDPAGDGKPLHHEPEGSAGAGADRPGSDESDGWPIERFVTVAFARAWDLLAFDEGMRRPPRMSTARRRHRDPGDDHCPADAGPPAVQGIRHHPLPYAKWRFDVNLRHRRNRGRGQISAQLWAGHARSYPVCIRILNEDIDLYDTVTSGVRCRPMDELCRVRSSVRSQDLLESNQPLRRSLTLSWLIPATPL